MKVITEQLKVIIPIRIFSILTFIMILALIPVLHIGCNIDMFTIERRYSFNIFLWIAIIIAFFIALAFYFLMIPSEITFRKLSKIKDILTNGVYTKAKVINIKETNSHTIFYLQLLHPDYKNIILEHKIPSHTSDTSDKSDQTSQTDTNRKEIPLKKSKNSFNQPMFLPIFKPSTLGDNIMHINQDNYLTVNSIVSVLYSSDYDDDWMLCPLWNIWKRDHWLDDYYQDTVENAEVYKQRIISKSKLFSKIFETYKIFTVIASLILAISLIHKGFFILVTIIACCLLLMWAVWGHFYFKRHHDFYEYSVATIGMITSATEIIEKNSKDNKEHKIWIYKYTFKTQNGIPYQGEMTVSPSSVIPYEKNSPATILYDPSCVSQNCLALYYPYSWIQPKETQNLCLIKIIKPEFISTRD